MTRVAPILVFDVNETLLDLASLGPLFARLFGEPAALRQWFAELILHSQAMTLSGHYAPFGEVAAGALRMVGAIRGAPVADEDVRALAEGLAAMPAHADVAPALARLRDGGFRLVTLTNSAPSPGPAPLDRAGIGGFFERRFSVDAVRQFKPAPAVYRMVAEEMRAPPRDLCLVACHAWDTVGAQAAGWQGAFVRRPGNAVPPLPGVPPPDFEAADLGELAEVLLGAAAAGRR